jgi:hypothetical protein
VRSGQAGQSFLVQTSERDPVTLVSIATPLIVVAPSRAFTKAQRHFPCAEDDGIVVVHSARKPHLLEQEGGLNVDVNLERRVEILEESMEPLRDVPVRLAAVESQIVQLRAEMRDGFSGVREELRDEIHSGDEALRTELRAGLHGLRDAIHAGEEALRAEMRAGDEALRAEVHAGDEALRAELRQGHEALREDMRALNDETNTHLRVLHEEVIGRIALLQEGRSTASPRSARRRRKTR